MPSCFPNKVHTPDFKDPFFGAWPNGYIFLFSSTSQVINFYMNLLVERSADPKLPSVNTLNTFFYPKLCSSGYSAVRRWTKKMDIFSKDILLVPVHLGVHWCLSVSIKFFFSFENLCCCSYLLNIFSLFVRPGGGFPEEVGPLLWFNGWKQWWSVSEVVVSPETCLLVCIMLFFISLSDVSPEELVIIPTVITCNRRAKTRRAKKWIPQAGLCTAKSAM